MMRWLHCMLLKGVFGGSADTVLAAIRKAFAPEEFEAPYIRPTLTSFPAHEIGAILQMQGKDPNITDDFVNALLDTRYGEKQAFSILALLAPYLDYKNGDFHMDHLHPASSFRTRRDLQKQGVAEMDLDFYRDERNWNSILNLRLLDSNENKSKQDQALLPWVKSECQRQKTTLEKFCADRDMPTDAELLEFVRFKAFISARREILHDRLKNALSS